MLKTRFEEHPRMHARAMFLCRICRLVCIGLSSLHFACASLPSAEVEALREIFQVAKLPWDEGNDPCVLSQVRCHDNRTVSTLFFSQLNITSLPESIGQLRSLEWLILSHNQLTEIPDDIVELQSLIMLDLNVNQLTSLPDSVGQLRSLKYLLVDGNRLDALPESIGQLSFLIQLSLNRNFLAKLPDSIGQLRLCQSIYLNSNHVAVLPESMGQLRNLSYLDLGSNNFAELPEQLKKLQSLVHLIIENNQMISLPEWIGGLKSLETLKVDFNHLTSLPESFSQLQRLHRLYMHNNQLTSIPASIGNLEYLQVLSLDSNRLNSLPESLGSSNIQTLSLDSNRLTSLPHLSLKNLVELRIANNHLTTLPDFEGMRSLRVLSLHGNFLERLSDGNLTSLKVALLHSNRISDPAEICRLGLGNSLRTLYIHHNSLGKIPPCLSGLTSLEVLTLHRNSINEEVPRTFAELPNLNVLTLHGNRLYGSLPRELANAPKLAFFSAHSNGLVGPIPPFKLEKDCVDDDAFVKGRQTCSSISPWPWASDCNHSDFEFHCPKTCQMCSTASARGPVLLLHDNRLACSLPEEVTKWPDDMRSITLIGNMLGNGSHALPQWIHTDEHQPFLYLSDNKSNEILKRTLLLASMFALFCVLLLGSSGHRRIFTSKAGSELTHRIHVFLFQMGVPLSILAVILFAFYFADARYYACSSGFSSSTLSNFSIPHHGCALVEWSVAMLWTCWVVVGAFFLRHAPTPTASGGEEAATSCLGFVLKVIYSCCWLCIVSLLSFPSVAYAVVSAIPFNNTLKLSAWWLKFFHYQAALVMVLVDMFITPKLVAFFSDATGMRRSMLLMAARLGTMWLAAVLSTFYLTTHCMNGWTHLWKVAGLCACGGLVKPF